MLSLNSLSFVPFMEVFGMALSNRIIEKVKEGCPEAEKLAISLLNTIKVVNLSQEQLDGVVEIVGIKKED